MLNHEHIYLEQIVPDHVPPYEALHTHFYTQETDGETSGYAPLSDKISNSIVYLSSHDGMGQISISLTVPSIYLAPSLLEPEDNLSTFDILGDDSLFQEVFIAPPKKPSTCVAPFRFPDVDSSFGLPHKVEAPLISLCCTSSACLGGDRRLWNDSWLKGP